MKIRHPLFVGLVAALAISLAIVAASAVAAETPFKGTVSAVETGTVVFPTRFLDREGTGTATYLGRYTEHVTMVINIPTLSSTGAPTGAITPSRPRAELYPVRVPPRSQSTAGHADREAPCGNCRDGAATGGYSRAGCARDEMRPAVVCA